MSARTPAVLLREELAAARRAGEEFEAAWRRAHERALAGLPSRSEAKRWAHAFTWARAAFEDGYRRKGEVGLTDVLDVLTVTAEEIQDVVPHGGMSLVA